MFASLCIACVDLSREALALCESMARADGAREEMATVVSRAAQELGVTLDPNASPPARLAAVMAAGREWI